MISLFRQSLMQVLRDEDEWVEVEEVGVGVGVGREK